jgi:hypothetical protein
MFRMMAKRTGAKLQNLIAEAATERAMTATAAWHLGIVNREPVWRSDALERYFSDHEIRTLSASQ